MIPQDNKNLALLQLFIQTTDEDPNINEDDKQVNIDEASTQESGNVVQYRIILKQEILAQDD